jgi:transcriptional regulator with XRE-family HTH domain
MSVGSELRWAREQAGLSVEQIAERTKIQQNRIEALERNNFAGLPGGIYLDGIVRAYASAVAIDPEALVNRARHERAKVADIHDVVFDDIDVVLAEESPVDRIGLIDASPARGAGIADRGRSGPPAGFLTVANAPATLGAPQEPVYRPRRRRRLALPLVAMLAIAGWGAYFYETTYRADRSVNPAIATSAPKAVAPAETPPAAAERYVPPNASLDAVPRQTAGVAPKTVPPPPVTSPAPAPTETAAASVRDVSGSWTMATNVESSRLADFVGLRLGYEIQLDQAGDRITGQGRKIIENGAAVNSQAQTPISLSGTIAGDRLTLTFTERGTERATQGKFVLLVEDGTLRGRFSSTAAQSSGTVEAHRK